MDTYGNTTYGGPGSSRSRGGGQSGFIGRASGGFGAPITMGGSRSRLPQDTFENQQDQPSGQSISNLYTPADITAGLGGYAPANPSPRPAPTSAMTADNPAPFAGTSFDPQRNIRGINEVTGLPFPTGGANSLPEGSQFVEGQGGTYTAANAPLDTSRFTPAPAPQPTPLTSTQQAEQGIQDLTGQVRNRYPELTFMNFLSGNPDRGGFSIDDPAVQANYAKAWGRPLNTALLAEPALQQSYGRYNPQDVLSTLQKYR